MKKYESPAIADFGSITECTFMLSAPDVTKKDGWTGNQDVTDGNYQCRYEGDLSKDDRTGQKNWQAMDCDKFGEYSHPGTNSGS